MKTVMTMEQLIKMQAIDGYFDSEVRVCGELKFPQKYEYLRPLFESDQYEAYYATGFNFHSPFANDLDFGYSYKMSESQTLNEIKSWFAAKAYFVRIEWWALKNAVDLALYNKEVYIPTKEEIVAAFMEEFKAADEYVVSFS